MTSKPIIPIVGVKMNKYTFCKYLLADEAELSMYIPHSESLPFSMDAKQLLDYIVTKAQNKDPQLISKTIRVPKPVFCNYEKSYRKDEGNIIRAKCPHEAKVVQVSKDVAPEGYIQYARCPQHCTSITPRLEPEFIEQKSDDSAGYEQAITVILAGIFLDLMEGYLSPKINVYLTIHDAQNSDYTLGLPLGHMKQNESMSVEGFMDLLGKTRDQLETLGLKDCAIHMVDPREQINRMDDVPYSGDEEGRIDSSQ